MNASIAPQSVVDSIIAALRPNAKASFSDHRDEWVDSAGNAVDMPCTRSFTVYISDGDHKRASCSYTGWDEAAQEALAKYAEWRDWIDFRAVRARDMTEAAEDALTVEQEQVLYDMNNVQDPFECGRL